jgi:hypothetical protein
METESDISKCILEKAPWSHTTNAPQMLKRLPNAPSVGRRPEAGEVLKALSRTCKHSYNQAANLARNEPKPT